MVLSSGGGMCSSREHSHRPVQVQDLFFILGSCYLSNFLVEVENRGAKSDCSKSVGCSVSV